MTMQNRKVRQSVPAPDSDLVSIWRGLLAAAKGGEQLRDTQPNKDLPGISERSNRQPTHDNGNSHGAKRSDDSCESAHETDPGGREAGYRQGYREGFQDGYKLRNSVQGTPATADKSTAGSNKTAARSMVRLRGLPCPNCGHSTYSDELVCPACGTPKARS